MGTLSPASHKRSEFQKLPGYFSDPVPLSFDLPGDSDFRGLPRMGQKSILEAIAHDDVPLEHLTQRFVTTPNPTGIRSSKR